MRLADYLDPPSRTASALAAKCECAVSTITRIARGELTPSVRLIEKIVAATGGEVQAADFFVAEGS